LMEEFLVRRKALMQANPGAAFLIPSPVLSIRNGDVCHLFRQDSDLYYLTGFQEAESCALLLEGRLVLFVLPSDPLKELWEGKRHGLQGAQAISGADAVYPITELRTRLAELLKDTQRLYYRLGRDASRDRWVIAVLQEIQQKKGRLAGGLLPVMDPSSILGEMRLLKSPGELELIKKACSISARAHRFVMEEVRSGMVEREVEARFEFLVKSQGCSRLGYPTIVAGGSRATCLHYHTNDQILEDGTCLLVDAGGEFGYYTADITRTFPVGKNFNKVQAKLYDLVLGAQKQAIGMIAPGVPVNEIHQRASEVLMQGVLSLDLLPAERSELGLKAFYPHATSHWLGLDVHDAGMYTQEGKPRLLEAGMVLTVEPGFYTQVQDTWVAEAYRGIGIRIEDNIHVTSEGCEVLTVGVPKERDAIESLRH